MDNGEDSFIVRGGKPLKGQIQLSGAKNVALKVLIAALLFDSPITFKNIPRIRDINELLHLINKLGAQADFTDSNTVVVDSHGLSSDTIDLLHAAKIRASFMFFAPLLYRFGKAFIPNPGGCRLGARPIDRHISMLQAFGVKVTYNSETGFYESQLNGNSIRGTTFTFDKPTHTGTELAIMLASRADGESVIKNAAQEPEIDDLINLLNQAGAHIKRENGSVLIKGTPILHYKNDSFTIMVDRNEAPTFASFGITTRGDIMIYGIKESDIEYFATEIKNIGAGVEVLPEGIRFYYKGELKSSSITTGPHPGFMTDWQGPWAVMMTQAHGVSTIHETIFEDRFGYVSELQKLGADIEFYQPELDNPRKIYQFNIENDDNLKSLQQAIRIKGPTQLHNGVMDVKDLRAGATILIAACSAEGESVINGASIIDRGYEDIERKLQSLGAAIKRV